MRPEARAHYEEDASERDRRERLLAAIRRVESVPALLAASPHLLIVGRAP